MRYLLYTGNATDSVMTMLNRNQYKLKTDDFLYKILVSVKFPYNILIDQKKKLYYLIYTDVDIHSITGDAAVLSFNNSHEISDEIKRLDFYSTANINPTISNRFEDMINNKQNVNKTVSINKTIHDFKKAFQPGRIVQLTVKGNEYFGIILCSNTIMYMDKKGLTKGYLNIDFDKLFTDENYTIHKILVPTLTCFSLAEYKQMCVAWSNEKKEATKVKKTKAEIEKELGLSPGTLEIY